MWESTLCTQSKTQHLNNNWGGKHAARSGDLKASSAFISSPDLDGLSETFRFWKIVKTLCPQQNSLNRRWLAVLFVQLRTSQRWLTVINAYIRETEFKGVHLHSHQDGFPTIFQMLAVGNFLVIMMLPDRVGAIRLVSARIFFFFGLVGCCFFFCLVWGFFGHFPFQNY